MNRKTTEIEKLAAAYLAGAGKKQTEIARILGVSQAVVSRMLNETRGKYWREHVEFLQENVDAATLQTLQQRVGKNKLAEGLRYLASQGSGPVRRGPELRVFSGGGEGGSPAEFTRHAAPSVRELLIRCRICGVTWGNMLWNLTNSIRAANTPAPWTEHPIDFVPLSGEPLGNTPTTFSSSSLASDLGRAANGDQYHARSLAMVPAFIPEDFTRSELRAVRKLIGLVESHSEIFGSDDPSLPEKKILAENLDMILTSVAPASQVLGFGKSRLLEGRKVTIERLGSLVIGDMGGVCFPRNDLTAELKRELSSVEDRWTGLRRAHLEACASAAEADPSKPGVVVVSAGANRAPFIYEAVRLGMINHLYIDEALASALEGITHEPSAQAMSGSKLSAGM